MRSCFPNRTFSEIIWAVPSRRDYPFESASLCRRAFSLLRSSCWFFRTDWRPFAGRSNLLVLLDILNIFDISTFRPAGGRSKWLILLNNILFFSTFRLLDLLLGRQNDQFYWIYWIFSTFWLFDLLLGGQTDRFYWIGILDFLEFSTFWPLGGGSKWSILLNILDFFDFSTFWPLGGGKNDKFYWI